MAGLFENSAEKKGFPSAAFLAVIICQVLFSSCSPETVLVVGDPYIELIQGSPWVPVSRIFILKARMAGYGISTAQADQEISLSEVISTIEDLPDLVIISPWNAVFLNRLPAYESRFIIAGAYPPDITGLQVNSVVPERSDVMKKLGTLAAVIAVESGKPAVAIFNAVTEVQIREMTSLIEAFGDDDSLIVRNIAETGDNQLPSDFDKLTADASVLLLFAGPVNITALGASDDAAVPVITESLNDSRAWNDRIVASVEDDPKALAQALMAELRSKSPEELRYYPARMVKGVLFSSLSR